METCKTCKFWRDGNTDQVPDDEHVGDCRRYPQGPDFTHKLPGIRWEWGHPQTFTDDWCGEWMPNA